MSTDAVAIIGFISLFGLMMLRVPVGMAMGLVGVSGFAYLVNGTAALKLVGTTSMRTVTDYTFGVIPMFLLMGMFMSNSGMSRDLFKAANGFVGHLRGGFGIRHGRCLRRLCRDLRLLGRHGGDVFRCGLSGNAPLRLSAELRHRGDRRRRHARRHAAAIHCARGVRHHHRAGHRQAVHRRYCARRSRHGDVSHYHFRHRPGPAWFPAGRSACRLAASTVRAEGNRGAGTAVRLRHRRTLRPALSSALHADRSGWRRCQRRIPDRRLHAAGWTRTRSWLRCCRRRARRPPYSRC